MGKTSSKNEPTEISSISSNDEFGDKLKYDPDFNGPLKHRSCTDVICLLLFLVFLACWGVVGYFAFLHGDPARLLVPTDSMGLKCGLDEVVKDKGFLVFFDLSQCAKPGVITHGCDTPQVCVKECPSENFLAESYRKTGTLQEAKRKLICQRGVNVDAIKSVDEMIKLTEDEKCAPWYLKSQSIQGRCVPIKDKKAETIILATFSEISNLARSLLNRFTNEQKNHEVPPSSPGTTSPEQVESSYRWMFAQNHIGQMVVDDLVKSWPWIIAGLVLAMLCCLIYIILMRWFASVMVWLSIVGVHALLSYCIYASYIKYRETSNNEPISTSGLPLEEKLKAYLAMKNTWLAFLIIASIALAIVLLMTIFLRNRIRVAVALIREASKAVGSVKSTLLFPLIPWVLQCVVIAWAVVLVLFLAGSGKEVFKVTGLGEGKTCVCGDSTFKDGSLCTTGEFYPTCVSSCKPADCRFYRFQTEDYVDYLHTFNVFGFFWCLFFVAALGEMILASTFATWYWTYNKADVPYFTLTESLGRTLRYNLGTVAFGSLILAICRMIRVLLEYIDHKLKKYDNKFVKAILCCCKCLFWCLERFIKFLNRNAYIMCAIHGKNFCTSARDAFNLLMRNVIRVFVLDKVTDFLLFMGKLMVTSGMVALAFFVFSHQIKPLNDFSLPDLNYDLVPVIIIGVGTYFISTIFFGVYSMAVDTLFLCFLEDGERNDGSVEKPFFMSKNLRKILNKKNKFA